VLELEALRQQAMVDTGLEDFGDPAFYEALERLLEALHTEARLNEFGHMRAEMTILDGLSRRLEIEDYLTSHPEVGEQQVSNPCHRHRPNFLQRGTRQPDRARFNKLLADQRRLVALGMRSPFDAGRMARFNHSPNVCFEAVEVQAQRRRNQLRFFKSNGCHVSRSTSC